MSNYRHFINGGATKTRLMLGFRNYSAPKNLSKLSRKLGDFIDYSMQPEVKINVDKTQSNECLTVESVPSIEQLELRIAIPTFKFNTGWGTRCLTRNEKFDILGLSKLQIANLVWSDVKLFPPIQPLALIVNSIALCKPLSHRSVAPSQVPVMAKQAVNDNYAYFPVIDKSIPNNWTSVHSSMSKIKSDKAPVPSEFWDARLKACYPNKRIDNLLTPLRKLALR